MNTNSITLRAEEEPAFAGTVKRKWRERLERRGIRLVLLPAAECQKPNPYEHLDVELRRFAGGR
ncbi:MAG: hypothetical protein DME19_01135 [Verrucomicrobia bacterium]|nr:MAG: hypothetical protein DME19_01135 [Verrucomicrobiota bacterium]